MKIILPLATIVAAATSLAPLSAFADVEPYTLTSLFRATVDSADRVKSKTEERVQAEENKTKARSGFLPQVNGVASYLRNDAPPPTATTASIYPQEQKTAKLVAKQYLFQGGSEYAYYDKAKLLIESKDAEVSDSRQQYYVDLASAYYDLLLKQSNLFHAKEELDNYDQQLTELNSRVKIGRSRLSDLLTMRAARASSESRLHQAESDLRSSQLSIFNVSRLGDVQVREENPVSQDLDTEANYLKASEQRPDLVASRKARDAVSEDIAYYRGFHFPTLDIGANYYLHREGANENSKWDATLTFTLPIFAGGSTQSNVRNAASVLRETEVQTGELERTAQTEIRQLHQTLVSSVAEMHALADAVDLATKAYEQTKKDYRFGLTTNLDLLNALRSLTDAKRSYDQAKYQHMLERIRLEIGAGRLPVG